jgi:hypothetical protein
MTLTSFINEPHLYSRVLLGIIVFLLSCLWLIAGVALTRSKWFGDNGTIAMIHYNFRGLGWAMFFFYVVCWPAALLARLIIEFIWAPVYYWYAGLSEQITLRMTADTRASLKELETGDLTELFRRMCGTYHFITDAKKKGGTFYLIDAQGEHHHVDFP